MRQGRAAEACHKRCGSAGPLGRGGASARQCMGQIIAAADSPGRGAVRGSVPHAPREAPAAGH